MATSIEPQDLDALLAVHALGALEPDERAAVEAALAADPVARQQLAAYERATALLHTSDGPSTDVWARIQAATIDADDRADTVVVPFALPARRRRPLTRIVAAAAAVAALVALALWGTGTLDQSYSPAPASDVQRAAQDALRVDGARRISLATPDGPVEVVLLPDGRGFVLDADLPELVDGARYRLSALTEQGQVLLAVLGDQIRATGFQLPAGVTELLLDVTGDGPTRVLSSAALPLTSGSTPGSGTSGSLPPADGDTPGAVPTVPGVPSVPVPSVPTTPTVPPPVISIPGLPVITLPKLPLPGF